MKLEVTPKAQQWFKEETGVQPETGIRFFGKIYGKTPVHDGFSIAMSVEAPDEPMIKENLDGITYFLWKATKSSHQHLRCGITAERRTSSTHRCSCTFQQIWYTVNQRITG